MHNYTKLTLILVALTVAACTKPGPIESAANQITDTAMKTRYANPADMAQLETRATNEYGMGAKKLVSSCAVAALKYVKVRDDQAAKIAAEIASPGTPDTAIRDLAIGAGNHMERCISLPTAYDISKKE